MSIPVQYLDVINGLLKKSMSKEVAWDVTTDESTFVVYFENFSLTICQNSNQNETWVAVSLINNNGDKVDSFWVSDEETDWSIINDLFSIARRSALSIDNAIQEMLTELNKQGTIGQKKKNSGGFADDIPF
jgi:hypothetical protein